MTEQLFIKEVKDTLKLDYQIITTDNDFKIDLVEKKIREVDECGQFSHEEVEYVCDIIQKSRVW